MKKSDVNIFYQNFACRQRNNRDVKHISPGFSPIPWVDLAGGGRCHNSFFSEYGLVAYQIKRNNAYNNMIANNLPADTPSTTGVGVKTFFSESSHVAYQFKGNGA